jgi:hypothetical protein
MAALTISRGSNQREPPWRRTTASKAPFQRAAYLKMNFATLGAGGSVRVEVLESKTMHHAQRPEERPTRSRASLLPIRTTSPETTSHGPCYGTSAQWPSLSGKLCS